MIRPTRTQVVLRYNYDSRQGRLLFREGKRQGKEAGSFQDLGFRRVSVNGRQYRVSHLIWLLETGEWPTTDIRPKNGNVKDARFSNLVVA